jgi:nucleotide-binding universal stress UspA family protein
LDGEIAHIITADQQGDLFSQSRSAQQTLQHAVELAQQVDRTRVPPIGMGMQEQMLSTTLSYLEAARSALQWVSAPEQENQDQAIQLLEDARQMKSELEKNKWLISR